MLAMLGLVQAAEIINTPELKLNCSYGSNLKAGTFSRSGLAKGLYNKAVADMGSTGWSWQYQTFGYEVDARAFAQVELEVLEQVRLSVTLNLRPLYFVPYEHWFAFVRPDNLLLGNKAEQMALDIDYPALLKAGMDAWMGGTYSLEFLKGTLEVGYNFASGRKSLIPYIMGGFREDHYLKDIELGFSDERAVSYEDAFIRFDVIDLWHTLSMFGVVNARALPMARAYLGANRELWGEGFKSAESTFTPEIPLFSA